MDPVLDKLTSISTQLVAYSYSTQRTSFIKDEQCYESWSLLICEEGSIRFRAGEFSGELQAGECVLCPPGIMFYRKALSTISFLFVIFHLQAYIEDNQVNFPLSGKVSLRNISYSSYIVDKMKYSKTSISPKYTEHLLNDLLYELIRERMIPQKVHKQGDPAIRKALDMMNKWAFTEINFHSIATQVGMYQSQFTRKFQKEMGVLPSHYITRLRIQKVIKLLTETNYSLERIAIESGYQNAFYLSRVFAKEMKMSPSQYRISHQV